MHLRAAQLERPLPEKNHDRLVMATEHGRFAVFDGASNAEASTLAAEVFEAQLSYDNPCSSPLTSVFTLIQRSLLERFGGRHLTTGTAIDIQRSGDSNGTATLNFAHAGDSSLYLFDRQAFSLTKLTRDEAPILPNGAVDARNFLGASLHTLQQYGDLILPRCATLALFSDGIGDSAPREGGVSEETLAEILSADEPCRQKARKILDASQIIDDASIIVVEYCA